MLTRLEIDGFKSLRDFAVDLEPFTVLIGPNSAGKSNVLEAIALLSRFAHMTPVEALQAGRGRILDQFSHQQGQYATDIRLVVELVALAVDGQSRFRVDLRLNRIAHSAGGSAVGFWPESVRGLERDHDLWASSHPQFEPWLEYLRTGDLLSDPDALLVHPARLGVTRPAAPRSSYMTMRLLEAGLESFNITLHSPQLRRSSERLASTELMADASNLPTVLAAMSPPLLGQVRAALSTIVPGVASFEIIPDKDLLEIEFILTGGERIPARLASDGTLRVLALLAAAFAPHGPKVICIEEPENGIYPRRLRDLLKILRERTLPCEGEPLPPQIILTTHSPVAISALRDTPECIRFVDTVRRNGQRVTRVRRLGSADDHGRTTVSVREIEELLDLGTREDDA